MTYSIIISRLLDGNGLTLSSDRIELAKLPVNPKGCSNTASKSNTGSLPGISSRHDLSNCRQNDQPRTVTSAYPL